ncbi:thiol-disulfide oxidoreductase ResA [Bacillus haynesii]|uniref:thiol-disulfide oxidoreductase ResA n=1 Tax=Bacillus haynesii TaxID=1925021 RepID=UPI00227F6ABA|nr:thiol-disulfide oxidoreductase ResA [Bacillus haynesii]MCY8669806.1 thiol-disulfide oxidoreductase ResA [Bacillus haynesii]
MSKRKRYRFWLRTAVLIALFSAVGFAFYQNLTPANKKNGLGLNEQAPNFKLTTLNCEEIELNKLKGKAVLVNFWGTWCEPCKREMPAIQDAYEQYKDKKFEIVAVNVQESDVSVKSFINNIGISFPIALDKTGEVYRSWNIFNLPSSIFINSEGIIERKYEGEISRKQLDQWINELLK